MMADGKPSRRLEAMEPTIPLVPHRPPLLLIDAVREVDAERCTTWTRVDPQAWYADPSGDMPGWFGLELMAQTIAAYSGNRQKAEGVAPKFGYLLGTRQYTCEVASFPAGALLEVEAKVHYADALGLSAFECELRRDGVPLARAILKVFEPA
jgi:predicted hotdog family 3-hydroxylacyl-ACP dehydratase